MTLRGYCDRCRDEMLPIQHHRAMITDPDGRHEYQLCERCTISLKVWIENRPYSLLPDGAPNPIYLEQDLVDA